MHSGKRESRQAFLHGDDKNVPRPSAGHTGKMGLNCYFSQGPKEHHPVIVVRVDRLTTVSTKHQVIHRSGILNPWLTRHSPRLPHRPCLGKIVPLQFTDTAPPRLRGLTPRACGLTPRLRGSQSGSSRARSSLPQVISVHTRSWIRSFLQVTGSRSSKIATQRVENEESRGFL